MRKFRQQDLLSLNIKVKFRVLIYFALLDDPQHFLLPAHLTGPACEQEAIRREQTEIYSYTAWLESMDFIFESQIQDTIHEAPGCTLNISNAYSHSNNPLFGRPR